MDTTWAGYALCALGGGGVVGALTLVFAPKADRQRAALDREKFEREKTADARARNADMLRDGLEFLAANSHKRTQLTPVDQMMTDAFDAVDEFERLVLRIGSASDMVTTETKAAVADAYARNAAVIWACMAWVDAPEAHKTDAAPEVLATRRQLLVAMQNAMEVVAKNLDSL